MRNDSLKFTIFFVLFVALLTSLLNKALAADIQILNHNFESDIVPLSPTGTSDTLGFNGNGVRPLLKEVGGFDK